MTLRAAPLVGHLCARCGTTTTHKAAYYLKDGTKRYYATWKRVNGEVVCHNCYQRNLLATNSEYRRKANERAKKWRMMHPDWKPDKGKHRRYNEIWGSRGRVSNYSVQVIESEVFVAQEVLPKLGFVEILITRPYHSRFCFDILAKDSDGKECGFDVKLSAIADIKPKRIPLIKHLGVRYFVVHVRPDYTFWYVNEMLAGRNRTSSAVGAYKKHLGLKRNIPRRLVTAVPSLKIFDT